MRQPHTFEIAVASREGAHTVRLTGELDDATAPRLQEELRRLVDDGARTIRLELGDLEFLDSTGLGVFVEALKALRETGGDMVLSSPRPAIRKVLEISGLANIFPIAPRA